LRRSSSVPMHWKVQILPIACHHLATSSGKWENEP